MVHEQIVNNFVMKAYIIPQTTVTPIKSVSVLCVSGGSGGGSGAPAIHTGIPTDEQW